MKASTRKIFEEVLYQLIDKKIRPLLTKVNGNWCACLYTNKTNVYALSAPTVLRSA